jgi:cyclic pyranopterin phosphate synthase
MENKNTDDIYPMIELTKHNDVSIRFIEEMPFNGEGSHYPKLNWTYNKIVEHIKSRYPEVYKMQDPENSTAYHYKIPGYVGDIGVIAAFSRTFCGTCNRLRVTAQGTLKTCLYDDGVLDIKTLMRSGLDNETIKQSLLSAFSNREANGWDAERKRKNHQPIRESMSTIGG